ncbi:MAG: tandem-95 repeat protein, partial [Anaerolineae bacterium]|nr:tandem-95 repeat protein [Anaerolineae bacterium]
MISKKKRGMKGLQIIVLIAVFVGLVFWSQPVVAQGIRADAVVLVNSNSSDYLDFVQYLQPYLDNMGIPYTVLDIVTDPVRANIGEYAVLIIGHRQLYTNDDYLTTTEESYISTAVNNGMGFVNFANDLSINGITHRYQFVQNIFGFDYVAASSGAGITFDALGDQGILINCWEDAHQEPVLVGTTSVPLLQNFTDGLWTEFEYTSRPYPSVMAGVDEENYGLPLMRFYTSDIPDGEYEVFANLYTAGSGRDARYYYGYTADDPKAHYVDTVGGSGGSEQHTEYSLGTVSITGGTFDLYVQDADLLGGTYQVFGWAWIRLVSTDTPPPVMHYITERHEPRESISTGSMMLAGIATPLPEGVEAVAVTGSQPFLMVKNSGQGRAVQWGSYDWMAHSVKGPIYGLDDLVWRSIVWAARKPFVMQGMPPLLPFRIDDCSGPFWWAENAADYGLKPWLGFFLDNISEAEADDMKILVDNGDATASVHAFGGSSWFYYDHNNQQDWTDAQVAANYAEATQWHQDHDIPISPYVLGHYYELGTNVFDGLETWGVEFIGTHMTPGTYYGAPWLEDGPYREYVSGSSRDGRPVYYADYITVPGHPEHDNKFFNVVTEIRDNAGYEWYPSNDVDLSIERGVIQSKRAFDSMVLATLFTHEQHIQGITRDNWNAILEGVTEGVADYDPIYVTMEYAAQYVRAMYTSDITESLYDSTLHRVTTTLGGETDLPTQFYLFTECGDEILEQRVDVPTFSGSTQVVTQLPGDLDWVELSPSQVVLGLGGQQEFAVQGYDADDVPVMCAAYTWNVVNGGGVIDQDGLFTAGSTTGVFEDTVVVSGGGGIEDTATVAVSEVLVDHFVFDPVADQVQGEPFSVTITALDVWGGQAIAYDGPATLTDTTQTVAPVTTGAFVDGVWTGEIEIGAAATDVTLTAQDASALGSSSPFTVTAPPPLQSYRVSSESYAQTAGISFTVTVSDVEPLINLWEDDHQNPVLETFTNSSLFNDTDGEWDEFHWSQRDYPGIFGGFTEAAAGTLEMMHFYADVPNGTYRVIANLYYSGSRRHYFGYTPDDARAYSVDVTRGGSDGFAEYDLVTITITDMHFDLYTDYGESISASFPYFGWAWIRLEPVVPETRINLWEDDHQNPVLVTTSSVPLLHNFTDGLWTEFQYGTRPYPSVMAGVNEEDHGLPLMHFYASDIPDGEYEVFANLYTGGTGRDARYYYGYTADEPKAYYVDTVGGSGGSEQHTEYSLGTVNITGGTFDLYVQDADLLGGTYEVFGWAWVRLVANRMTMTSTSPTMVFDGDDDGVFGEPGDDLGVLNEGSFDIAARDTTAGTGVVITATDNAGNFGWAAYSILPAPATSVDVTPDMETALAGRAVMYQATAEDVYGNVWDVAGETTFSLEAGAGGGCVDNVCTGQVAGSWEVTGQYAGHTDSVDLQIVPAADLNLTKTASHNSVWRGTALTYTLTIANDGPDTVVSVRVTDTLDTGVILNTATASQGSGCSSLAGIVSCDLGDIPGYGTATVILVVTPAVLGDVENVAEVAGTDPFGNLTYAEDTVSVESINISPEAIDDTPLGNDAVTTDEDTAVTLDVLGNDTDVNGDILTISGVGTVGTRGTVTNQGSVVYYDPSLAFQYLAVGERAQDVFTYTVNDGYGGTDTAAVTVTIAGVNDAPDAVDDVATANEDTLLTVSVTNGVLGNDTDVDINDTLTVSDYDDVSAYAATAVLGGDGSYTYDPTGAIFLQILAPGASLVDTFTYTVEDSNGGTDTATVSVTVAGVNDAPIAGNNRASTNEETPVMIAVLADDSDIDDGDSLTVDTVGIAAYGAVTNNGMTVTYIPLVDFNGTDSFTYTVRDSNGGTATATVIVTVIPVNDTPVAEDDAADTGEETPVTVDVLANDSDVDGDSLTVGAVGAATHGSVVNNASDVTYTPVANFYGTDSFTYTVRDGNGGAATATVVVTVIPANDAPVAEDDAADTDEEMPVTVDVLANDSDIEGDTLVVDTVGIA